MLLACSSSFILCAWFFLTTSASAFTTTASSCSSSVWTKSTRTQLGMAFQQPPPPPPPYNGTDFFSVVQFSDVLLRAHQEMEDDMREWEAAQARARGIPRIGADGVYQIVNQEQYCNFRTTHSDKLVVWRVLDPLCDACEELREKFRIHCLRDHRFQDSRRVVVADVLVSNNIHVEDPFKEFVALEFGVTDIPHVQFHVYGTLVGDVPCHGGYSWAQLKQTMVGILTKYEGILWR